MKLKLNLEGPQKLRLTKWSEPKFLGEINLGQLISENTKSAKLGGLDILSPSRSHRRTRATASTNEFFTSVRNASSATPTIGEGACSKQQAGRDNQKITV